MYIYSKNRQCKNSNLLNETDWKFVCDFVVKQLKIQLKVETSEINLSNSNNSKGIWQEKMRI